MGLPGSERFQIYRELEDEGIAIQVILCFFGMGKIQVGFEKNYLQKKKAGGIPRH